MKEHAFQPDNLEDLRQQVERLQAEREEIVAAGVLAKDLLERKHQAVTAAALENCELAATVERLTQERDAGARFKAFVHSYLDSHGVPHGDPDNEHQKRGCRIGARLDLLFAQRDLALADAAACNRAAKCNQTGCSCTADFRFTWPGKDEAGICLAHSVKLRAIAAAIGLHIQLIPLLPEGAADA